MPGLGEYCFCTACAGHTREPRTFGSGLTILDEPLHTGLVHGHIVPMLVLVPMSKDKPMNPEALFGSMRRVPLLLAALSGGLVLSACVSEPPVRTVSVNQAPMPRMFVYPSKGQSEEQLERDRYECHTWAVGQTGFDPSAADAQTYRQVVAGPPPGTNTAIGAIGGAILGSIIAGPRDGGFGTLFGAATGAVVGSTVDANNQAAVAQAQHDSYRQSAAARARAESYRRAIGACLQARGYTVG